MAKKRTNKNKQADELVSVMTEQKKLLEQLVASQKKSDYENSKPSSQRKAFLGTPDDPARSPASYGAALSRRFSAAIGGGVRVFAEQTDNIITDLFEKMDFGKQLRQFNSKIKNAQTKLNKDFEGWTLEKSGSITKTAEALEKISDLDVAEIEKMDKLFVKLNGVIDTGTSAQAKQYKETLNTANNLQRLAAVSAGATLALIAFRSIMLESARDLGGVNLGQAIQNLVGTAWESLASLVAGDYVTGGEIRRMQSAYSDEFGGLAGAHTSARRAQFAQRAGLQATETIALERALQSFGVGSENAVNQFRDVGIVSRVATQEIVENADAVARSGDNFNAFIVQGVRNAKRLGLEFSKIEGTLTGFSTDFTGTVQSFSQLRSILPSFGVNFNQLLQTSLYGTTDEYISLIRSSLAEAGITDMSQLSRAQMELLSQATGFGGAEMQRIFGDEIQDLEDLDRTRNDQLGQAVKTLLAIGTGLTALTFSMSAGFGVVTSLQAAQLLKGGGGIGSLPGLMMSRFGVTSAGLARVGGAGIGTGLLVGGGFASSRGHMGRGLAAGAAGGAIAGGSMFGFNPYAILGGAALGGIASLVAGRKQNDFVFRPGQPVVPFSSNDTLIGMKDISKMGGGSINTSNLERKVDQLVSIMREGNMAMSRGMELRIKDFDRALLLRRESEMRNA